MHFELSVHINRPIDEVFAFGTNWFNTPRDGSVLALRQTSPGAPGVGSTFEGRRVILGFETRFSAQITEWDPPHAVTFSGSGGPFRSLVARATLESKADGTEIVESRDVELRPALKVLGPLFLAYWKRRTKAGDENFKRLIEAQPARD